MQVAFLIVTYGSLVVAALLFAGIMYFAWVKNLLLIPEKQHEQ